MILSKKNVVAVMLLSLMLNACGSDEKSSSKKSSTQVVAKVNGDEISVHQVNLQLARLGKVSEDQGKQASRQIVSKLVEQQLLNQQALADKMDRDPRILQVMEAAKSEILAQAYLEKLAAKAKKPSDSEISTFYKEHPELFEKRRLFRIQELVVDAPKEKFAEIESGIKDMKDINQIATWLKTNQFQFNANSNVKAAEQLPAGLLQQLQPLNNGEFAIVKSDKAIAVLHLAASQSAPIALDKAKPIIEQYFLNINKATVIKKEVDALKEKAKVEFMGDFSDMQMTADATAPSSEPVSKAPENSATTEPKKDTNHDQANISKGLAGM
jgi:EpsD family peptidyl-prolyl cis-trans isomerase